jgi:hypothetical protein
MLIRLTFVTSSQVRPSLSALVNSDDPNAIFFYLVIIFILLRGRYTHSTVVQYRQLHIGFGNFIFFFAIWWYVMTQTVFVADNFILLTKKCLWPPGWNSRLLHQRYLVCSAVTIRYLIHVPHLW